jgi:ABC-2 type transport system ATP-binding protein
MTVGELCRYTSHFYESWDTDYAQTLSGRWGLARDRRVGGLSTGEQRKIAILLALASRPEVLVLDEPVANLDPIARREIIDEIIETITSELGCTVLFSTHLLGDLERVAEFVGMVDRGRMALSDRLESWQNTLKRVQVIFPNSGTPPGFGVPGALRSWTCGPVVTAIARVTGDFELEAIRKLPGVRVNVFGIGLEELFLELFAEGKERSDVSSEPENSLPAEEPADKILSIHQTR